MGIKWMGCTAAVLVVFAWASPSVARQNRPNTTFLFGGDLFSSGQSDNIGPVALQILSDHWVEGACPDDTGDYRFCDTLRFGMALYPHAEAGETCSVKYNHLHAAQEDGGDLVEKELQNIQNLAGTTYCDDPANRPMDAAMVGLQAASFQGTDAAIDSPWDRPNLNLSVVSEFPQTPDGSGGHQTAIRSALQASCDLLLGDDGNGPGSVPSIPTWVMVARQFDDEVVPFAGLASAAGGTAECCYDPAATAASPASCEPTGPKQIDVCEHIAGRSEAVLEANILARKYSCGPGDGYVQVGQMAYPNVSSAQGIQKAIQCHLVGRYNQGTRDQCSIDSSLEPTDILGKMACVRQIPRDFEPETMALVYCDNAGNCTELTDCSDAKDPADPNDACAPNIEWVDPNKTLYVIIGHDAAGNKICDEVNSGGGTIVVDPCPRQGDACEVPGKTGRCQPGTIQCVGAVEYCQQIFDPMPEICNGLDDDCEGRVDNLSDSWDNFPYSPTSLGSFSSNGVDRQAIHCHERDVCRDVGVGAFEHVGMTYPEYITNWVPDLFVCSEGLSAEDDARDPTAPDTTRSEGMACSATGDDRPGSGALLVFAVFAAGVIRRRARQRPDASRR